MNSSSDSNRSDQRSDEKSSFQPNLSATDLVRRRRLSKQHGFARACKNLGLYAGYVLFIGLCAGVSQAVTALLLDVPLRDSLFLIARSVGFAGAGAFIGLAFISLLIVTPVIPIAPGTVVVRVSPDTGGPKQWEREARALLGAGLLVATVACVIGAQTVEVHENANRTVALAGSIGCALGMLLFVVQAFGWRKPKVPPTPPDNC